MLAKLYRLICDDCGAQTPPYQTSQQLRRSALTVWRWTRRKVGNNPPVDLCPKCAARH